MEHGAPPKLFVSEFVEAGECERGLLMQPSYRSAVGTLPAFLQVP